MFYPLLDNLPNLKSFTGTLGTHDKGSLKKQCLSLTNLSLETYDRTSTPDGYQPNSMMSFDEMIDLYKCLPNLEETNLYVFNSGSLETKIDYLNRILSQCPKLKSFDCFIAYYGASSTSIDKIKQRSPLFEDCSAGTWPTRRIYECRIRK